MGKRKIAIYGLIALVIILCMITIYMQMENNRLRITNNRLEGDYETLKKDYEKLYAAYYSYDKKILEILKFSDKVYWAEDSSAYMVVKNEKIFFSFFKKPRMEHEYCLWANWKVLILNENSADEVKGKNVIGYVGRVDTLKPHQWMNIDLKEFPDQVFLAPAQLSMDGIEMPDESHKISLIHLRDN